MSCYWVCCTHSQSILLTLVIPVSIDITVFVLLLRESWYFVAKLSSSTYLSSSSASPQHPSASLRLWAPSSNIVPGVTVRNTLGNLGDISFIRLVASPRIHITLAARSIGLRQTNKRNKIPLDRHGLRPSFRSVGTTWPNLISETPRPRQPKKRFVFRCAERWPCTSEASTEVSKFGGLLLVSRFEVAPLSPSPQQK